MPQAQSKPKAPHARPPKLVGVHVRPREEHLAELLGSADSAQAGFDEGRFAPERVRLPGSRMLPVYETEEGRRVTLVATPTGFEARPFRIGQVLDRLGIGAIGGGFARLEDSPPLPIAGGADPESWVRGYVDRVPESTDRDSIFQEWDSASGRYADAVADRTAPESDEWRRRYFEAIRAAARSRESATRSLTASPRGERYFMNGSTWEGEEYHGAVFRAYERAAEESRTNLAASQSAAPDRLFAHPAMLRMLALAGAIQKNRAALPAFFQQALEPDLSKGMGPGLLGHLRTQAGAPKGQGAAIDKLRGALDIVKKLNDAGGGKRLAELLGKLAGGDGSELDKLKGDFARKLAGMGVTEGLEKIVGKDAADILSRVGATDALADAAKNVLLGGDSGLADGLGNLLAGAPDKIIDLGLDKLVDSVDDDSPMARQLLAKYKDQLKGLLKKLIASGGLDDLKKQWDSTWNGIPSKASVPLGLADPVDGADMVLINGLPATRIGDICKWPQVPDAGPFFQGNPTITVNGMPPSGAIHAAKGATTIGTPLLTSPNVLMGEATVTVKIRVETDSGATASASSPASPTATPGAASNGTPAGSTAPPAPSDWSLGGILGKLWALPNTLLGGALGLVGLPLGALSKILGLQQEWPGIDFDRNGLIFTNNPMAWLSAITFGNTMIFGPKLQPGDGRPECESCPGTALDHERAHTYQAQQLGPFYLLSNLAGGFWALLNGESWHGPSNWNERGPQSDTPVPWRPKDDYEAEVAARTNRTGPPTV